MAGGVTTYYYSWRVMQAIIGIGAAVMLFLVLAILPETSHPGSRGVDKMVEKGGKSGWVWLNPFRAIALLRSPNVFLVVSYFWKIRHQSLTLLAILGTCWWSCAADGLRYVSRSYTTLRMITVMIFAQYYLFPLLTHWCVFPSCALFFPTL